MFHTGGDFSLAFAFTFSALSTRSHHHINPNAFGHPPGVSRGYLTVCSASGMGRMDCPSIDYTDPGQWYHNMCDEEDPSE